LKQLFFIRLELGAVTSPALVACATGVAIASLSSAFILDPKTLNAQLAVGYTPILLGCLSMWLCFKARQKARHKRGVLLYAILLAPIAFCYPALMIFIWLMYVSGKYTGPMP
jgi:hypothetical protein